VERLEQRQLLTANVWFEDSGQQLGSNMDAIKLGDLDGDGDLDALFGCRDLAPARCSESQVWLNNGSGEFSKGWSRTVTSVGEFTLGDLDHDGDLDAFFVRTLPTGNPPSEIWLNDGQGNFEVSGQRLNNTARDVSLADVDGDGDWDAITAEIYNPGRVWLNDGTGTFTDSGQRLGTSTGRSVGLGDLDGDGDLDAVVGNGATLGTVIPEPNAIWLNDGSGVFTLAQELGDAATTSVALGDIDNDGDLDALFANLGHHNEVWFNTQPIAGDANRDGVFNQLDIVQVLQAANYQTGQPATWAEGDFNRDGVFDQLDIVAALQTGKYGQA
jgi:hypothetical protein